MNFTFSSTVAVIAHGYLELSENLCKRLKQFNSVYLVDGGANYLFQLEKKFGLEIHPKAIIGDFDSIDQEAQNFYEKQLVPQVKIDRAKDKTDLETALEIIASSFPNEKITIFGAFGKRIDHTLGNFFLLSNFPNNVFLESENEVVFLIKESSQEMELVEGQTLSLIPLFGSCIVTTKGLKWELNNTTLNFAGLSNISLEGHCKIDVRKGQLLCIINSLIDKEMIPLQDHSSTSSYCRIPIPPLNE